MIMLLALVATATLAQGTLVTSLSMLAFGIIPGDVGSIGVYSDTTTPFAVFITAIFGLLGYLFHKLSCPLAPLLMGFIMAPAPVGGRWDERRAAA